MDNILQFDEAQGRNENGHNKVKTVTDIFVKEWREHPPAAHLVKMIVGGETYEKWNYVSPLRYEAGIVDIPETTSCKVEVTFLMFLPSPTEEDLYMIKFIEENYTVDGKKAVLTSPQRRTIERICDLVYHNRAASLSPVTTTTVTGVLLEKIEFVNADDTHINCLMLKGVISYIKQFLIDELKCVYAGAFLDANKDYSDVKNELDALNININEDYKLMEYYGENDNNTVISKWEITE